MTPPASGQLAYTESYGDPLDPDWPTVITAGYGGFEGRRLPDGTTFESRIYAYDSRYFDGGEYVLEIQQPATSGTLNGFPLTGNIPWDGVSPITLQIDVPPGRVGFYVTLGVAGGGTRAFINSRTNEITLPSEAVRLGAD